MSYQTPTLQGMASWPPPNLVNPETRASLALGIEILLCFITILFLAGRFYSRITIRWTIGPDDWVTLIATACPHSSQL